MRALLCTALSCPRPPAPPRAGAHAGSLVDLAVVDRDTGETLRTYRTTASSTSPARPAIATRCA